jgi:hypothetical protein
MQRARWTAAMLYGLAGLAAALDRSWGRTLVALAIYAFLTRLSLPLLQRAARKHTPVNLLVLRTFGSAGRSRRLFEQVATRWRSIGPLHLIAGADSATANLDLAEAVRYLTFRFRSLYVSDAADLERRRDASPPASSSPTSASAPPPSNN